MTHKQQLEEIYEYLVGEGGTARYTHEELIEYIQQLTEPNYNPAMYN